MSDPGRDSTSARVSLIVTALIAAVFVVLAILLIPWHWLPGGHVDAVPATSVFTDAQIDRAERVSGMLRYAGWANLALGIALALVLGLTRAGARLVGRLPGRWWLQALLAAVVVTALTVLVQLPLSARN